MEKPQTFQFNCKSITLNPKGLKLFENSGIKANKVLMLYPSGRGIALSFPPSPYFQTWFCNGGAYSDEFTFAGTGMPVLTQNWDRQGIEIGSSPLDHNGNIDTSVDYRQILQPGEILENRISLEVLKDSQTESILDEILNYG